MPKLLSDPHFYYAASDTAISSMPGAGDDSESDDSEPDILKSTRNEVDILRNVILKADWLKIHSETLNDHEDTIRKIQLYLDELDEKDQLPNDKPLELIGKVRVTLSLCRTYIDQEKPNFFESLNEYVEMLRALRDSLFG